MAQKKSCYRGGKHWQVLHGSPCHHGSGEILSWICIDQSCRETAFRLPPPISMFSFSEFITPKRCSGWSNALQNFLSEKEAVDVLRKGSWEFKLAPLVLIKDGVCYVLMVSCQVRSTKSIGTSSHHIWGGVHPPVNMGDKGSHGYLLLR